VIRSGRAVEDFVSLTDLAPTFLGIAGLEPAAVMTGTSLIELLRGSGNDGDRDHVLFGKERHVPCQEAPESGGTPMRAIRTRDYLYIRNFEANRWPAGTPDYENAYLEGSWYGDVDNGPTKTYMIDNRDRDPEHRRLFELAFGKRPAEELYDLRRPGSSTTLRAILVMLTLGTSFPRL
jgi:arylsulfatase A-like enzyme